MATEIMKKTLQIMRLHRRSGLLYNYSYNYDDYDDYDDYDNYYSNLSLCSAPSCPCASCISRSCRFPALRLLSLSGS